MTTIAILGATGHIGKALAAELNMNPNVELLLYARRPDAIKGGLDISEFGKQSFDVVINAVGAGTPVGVRDMGTEIFTVTETIDNSVLAVLENLPDALYLFLSSGAVYGTDFTKPAQKDSVNRLPINTLDPSYFYGLSKINAEAKHRGHSDLNIIDLRVFSFFSRFIDLEARFFITDAIHAIQNRTVLKTSQQDINRDFVTPPDLVHLISCCIKTWRSSNIPVNATCDVYSKAPAGKFDLLNQIKAHFPFEYELEDDAGLVSTGPKSNYYSLDNSADAWGYTPEFTSIDGVLRELSDLLATPYNLSS
jgi:nucleoside-diphosphate-sugar epimerase